MSSRIEVRDAAELAEADRWEADTLTAIENVQDPAEAERLLGFATSVAEAMRLSELAGDRARRWAGMKLKAEARYGELLGEAEHGGNRKSGQVTDGNLTGADRKAQHEIRKVAAAKRADPDGFTDYTENDPKPTRAGLLRKAGINGTTKRSNVVNAGKRKAPDEPTIDGDAGKIANDPDVLSWVRARTRRGWSTSKIIATSKEGGDGWPEGWPEGLGDQTVSAIRTAIFHLEQYEKLNPKRKRPQYSGKRLREIAAVRKRKTYPPLFDVMYRIVQLTAALETDRRPVESYDLDDTDVIRDLYNDLAEFQPWSDHVMAVCESRLSDADRLATIRKLRNTDGRSDAEAEAFRRKADELEVRLVERELGA